MAEKVKAPPVPSGGRLRVSWLPWAMLAAAALGGTAAFWWQRHARAAETTFVLPAWPEVSGRPAELGRILGEARQRVTAEGPAVGNVSALGLIFHANGYLDEAGVCWQWLRAADPGEARWCYYLSDLSRMRADETALRSWLEETVRLAPDYAPAWLELAELEFKTGRHEAAGRAYRQRLQQVPGDPYASLGLARLALQADRREEGKRLLQDLIKRVPEFPSSHNLYAEILAQDGDRVGAANQRWFGMIAGRFRAADDPWKEALRPWCCDVDQLVVWGAIDLQTKHGDRGRAYFERAVQIDPRDPLGAENLGMFLLDAGNDPARAAEVLEQGSRLPRASERLFGHLGDAYLALHQPAKALEVAARGLERMPGSSRFHNLRGQALADSHREEESIAAYREAMALAPSSAEPLTNLALVQMRLGRRDEALANLRRALEQQPGYILALTNLARLEMEAGNLADAAKLIFPYFQQFPGDGNARALLSRFYLMSALAAAGEGNSAGIEQACRSGLALVPESPELNGFLGLNYLQQGRLDEALVALEKSYRLQPADPRIAFSLVELYLRIGRAESARPVLDNTETRARQRQDNAVLSHVAELRRRLP